MTVIKTYVITGEEQNVLGAEWLELAGDPKPKLYPQKNLMPCAVCTLSINAPLCLSKTATFNT